MNPERPLKMSHCPTWSRRHGWVIPSPILNSVKSTALLIARAIHIVMSRLPAVCAIPLIYIPCTCKGTAVTKTIVASWCICTTSSCVSITRCIWKSPWYARPSMLASGWSSTSWTLQALPLHQLNHKNPAKLQIYYCYTIISMPKMWCKNDLITGTMKH